LQLSARDDRCIIFLANPNIRGLAEGWPSFSKARLASLVFVRIPGKTRLSTAMTIARLTTIAGRESIVGEKND
jgi:hypothetical protein